MIVLDIPNTLGAHESAPRMPEISATSLIRCRIEAQERVTADVDTFADWIYSQCYQAPAERFGYVPSSDVSRAQFIQSLSVPQLAAALLYPDRDLAGRAASELRDRFLKTQDDRIEQIAAELMAQGWAE